MNLRTKVEILIGNKRELDRKLEASARAIARIGGCGCGKRTAKQGQTAQMVRNHGGTPDTEAPVDRARTEEGV